MVRDIVDVQLSARKCLRGIGMARNCRARNCLRGIVGAQLSCAQMSGCPSLEGRAIFLDISKAFDKVWHDG